jgi:uncharacterized membrane-anchored protein
MPGFLPHLIAGFAMFFIGRYYYNDYFVGKNKLKENFLLLFICLFFSFIVDIFLIVYYLTKVFPLKTFLPYHNLAAIIAGPIVIFLLFFLMFKDNIKYKPILIIGLWSIILHLVMDFFLPHAGLWI